MKIVLYSYQSKEAVAKLKRDGVLRVTEADKSLINPSSYQNFPAALHAYEFMVYEMKKRLPAPTSPDCAFPIWGWYKSLGKNPPSKHLDGIHRGNIRLRIEIDEERVLLSDFDMFAYLYCGGLYFKEKPEDDEFVEKHLFDPIEVFYPNMEQIFTLHRKRKTDYAESYRKATIQGTFWELFLEDVTEIKDIPSDFPCEILDYIEKK